jgi:hypothetical protein
MNRRSLLRILPGLLGVPAVIKAEVPARVQEQEPSPWVYGECQRERWNHETGKVEWRCGTRFKFIRGAQPICPRCGCTMYINDLSKMAGIPVESE